MTKCSLPAQAIGKRKMRNLDGKEEKGLGRKAWRASETTARAFSWPHVLAGYMMSVILLKLLVPQIHYFCLKEQTTSGPKHCKADHITAWDSLFLSSHPSIGHLPLSAINALTSLCTYVSTIYLLSLWTYTFYSIFSIRFFSQISLVQML